MRERLTAKIVSIIYGVIKVVSSSSNSSVITIIRMVSVTLGVAIATHGTRHSFLVRCFIDVVFGRAGCVIADK